MFWSRGRAGPKVYIVQTDGALMVDGSAAGLGVVVRDAQGRIVRWVSRRTNGMTNNEAEYAAICLALEVLGAEEPEVVHLYSDSEIAVGQMQGQFRVLSSDLKPWHRRACQLARRIRRVTYTHIPRERNRLADALATEALLDALPPPGRDVRGAG
ncbi:MAG: ribonuclease HI family protein [Ardenticatenaceae bacterium]